MSLAYYQHVRTGANRGYSTISIWVRYIYRTCHQTSVHLYVFAKLSTYKLLLSWSAPPPLIRKKHFSYLRLKPATINLLIFIFSTALTYVCFVRLLIRLSTFPVLAAPSFFHPYPPTLFVLFFLHFFNLAFLFILFGNPSKRPSGRKVLALCTEWSWVQAFRAITLPWDIKIKKIGQMLDTWSDDLHDQVLTPAPTCPDDLCHPAEPHQGTVPDARKCFYHFNCTNQY